ncbi:MAG: HEAT repeat domain-containing protein, partial [Candidatus Marinimicrobia bacterium]|nr:HEAT repeat domain-containing protein [Candidatus Neomarinimicrobiota bacterium]
MPKSLSDNQKNLASLYVLDAFTEAEQITFENELAQNEDLQSYVRSLESTLNVTSSAKMATPDEIELQSQRNLLRTNIDAMASEEVKIAPGIWEYLKAWIQTPTPAWVNLASVAAAFALGLYMMKPIPQQTPEKPEIDIKELLRSGQLGQIKFADNGHRDGQIRLAVESRQDLELSGSANDELITNLLFYLLLHDQNPGKRLKAVKLLQNSQPAQETKMVLVSALLTDSNPGIRLKSIRLLSTYEPEKVIQDACMKVLLEDENEAIRLSAMDIIEMVPNSSMIPALQVVSVLDENDFIRD